MAVGLLLALGVIFISSASVILMSHFRMAFAYKCEGFRFVGVWAHRSWPFVVVLGQCRDHTLIYSITGHKKKISQPSVFSVWVIGKVMPKSVLLLG
jgi:hypothetical protein